MSPFIRGTLYGLGVAAAFAGGYLVREVPIKLVVGTPAVAAEPPPVVAPASPREEPAELVGFQPGDQADPHFQAVKAHFHIEPSVVDRSQPVPEVLRDLDEAERGPMPRMVK